MDVRAGPKRKLSTEELMPSNCGIGEDFESPLDCKEIKPVHPKGNQSWIFIGRTETEAPVFWPPVGVSWLIEKDPDAGKDWGKRRWRQQRMSWLEGVIDWMDICLSKLLEIMTDRDFWHAWCSWGHEEPDITERLNNEISIIGCQKMPSSVIPPSCCLTPFNLHRMWDMCYIFQIRNMIIKKFK